MAAPVNSRGNLKGERFPNVETVIGRMLPTPVASIYKDVGPKGSQSSIHQSQRGELCGVLKELHPSIPTGEPMFLNPCFVEAMMGYEDGWTDLEP
jgi:hypothetical protein